MAILIGAYLWQIRSATTSPLKVKVNSLCYNKHTWHSRSLTYWSWFLTKSLFCIQTFGGHIMVGIGNMPFLEAAFFSQSSWNLDCLHFIDFMEKNCLLVSYCFVTNYTNYWWVKTTIILPRILLLGNLIWDWLNLFFWSLLISAEIPQAST